eukprot:2176861-Karenia_brevis.AAC.1
MPINGVYFARPQNFSKEPVYLSLLKEGQPKLKRPLSICKLLARRVGFCESAPSAGTMHQKR